MQVDVCRLMADSGVLGRPIPFIVSVIESELLVSGACGYSSLILGLRGSTKNDRRASALLI